MRYEEDRVKCWADKDTIEKSALKQIQETSKHPRLYKYVAIMADVHMGYGCTIGSVVPLLNAVMPAAVGYDIGCGMCAMKTSLKLEEVKPHFKSLCDNILERIPVGFHHRSEDQVSNAVDSVSDPDYVYSLVSRLEALYPDKPVINQLGTLGGGNHFIELQTDNEGYIWVMIHSGSRNIGHTIASKYIKIAEEIERDDVPKDMEYLDTRSKEADDYLYEMDLALEFAYQNRELMMNIIREELTRCYKDHYADRGAYFDNGEKVTGFDPIINIHHNFVAEEKHFGERVWVHRKGATQAISGQLGIIPGSMGTKSYIVEGKSNPDSFNSCSHGAGRLMSRTQAKGKWHRRKKEFTSEGILTVEQFEKDMQGVYSEGVDRQHLDEAPRAYKDINIVMANQTDLVDIVEELTPVMNIKG